MSSSMKARQTNAAALEQLRKQKEKRDEAEQTREERKVKSRVKMGWMVKKGAKRRNWKRRYFQLKMDEKELRYFPSPDVSGKPLGVINLSSALIVRMEVLSKAPGVPAFSITLPHRCYIFIPEDDVERNLWVKKIKAIGVHAGHAPTHYFGTKEWEDEAKQEIAQVQGSSAVHTSGQTSSHRGASAIDETAPPPETRARQPSFVSLFRFGKKGSATSVSKSTVAGSPATQAEDLIPLNAAGQAVANTSSTPTPSSTPAPASIPSSPSIPLSSPTPTPTPTPTSPSVPIGAASVPVSSMLPLVSLSSTVPSSSFIPLGSGDRNVSSTSCSSTSNEPLAPLPPPRSAKDRDRVQSFTSSDTTSSPGTNSGGSTTPIELVSHGEASTPLPETKTDSPIESSPSPSKPDTPPSPAAEPTMTTTTTTTIPTTESNKKKAEDVEYEEYVEEYEYEYEEEEVWDDEIEEIVEWVDEDEDPLAMNKRMTRLYGAVNKKLDDFKNKVAQTERPDVASQKAAAYERKLKRMTMAVENKMKRQTANLQNMSLLLKMLNNTG